MRTMPLIAALGAVALTIGSCSGDDTDQLRAENEDLIAEVEALRAEQDLAAARYEASSATIAAIEAILADPESFGTETQIANSIADLATADAQMEDDVFGSIDYRTGFYDTLFGGATDAVIDVYDHWLSDDGSQGGSLWVWRGTNVAGNPFELVGISLTQFDEDGKITHELVTYPYSDEYVVEAFEGAGTVPMAIATDQSAAQSSQARPFSFTEDDLCTWLTEDDLTAAITAAYEWEGEVTSPTETAGGCSWSLTGGDEFSSLVIGPAEHDDADVVSWDETLERDPTSAFGKLVVGHPDLSDGVGYLVGGFGYLAFGVPEIGRYFQMLLIVPGEDAFVVGDGENHMFAVADQIVRNLGWLGPVEAAR